MMCSEEGCFRAVVTRDMCNAHYLRRKRAGTLGPLEVRKPRKPTTLERLAQEGRNLECVDCGGVTLLGGMRCLPCFQVRCEQRSRAA
jgi:hypothetical protein